MGEATYYLKAKFTDPEQAQLAASALEELLNDFELGYRFWQDRRTEYPTFWTEFQDNFPLLFNFINNHTSVNTTKYDHNSLAGVLSYTHSDVFDLTIDENELRYYAMVWHFADWDPLVNWLETNYQCKADYISDEYIDYFNCINL